MWAVREWDDLTIERRAVLVNGQQEATIEYRVSVPTSRLPLRLKMPATLPWCREERKNISTSGLVVSRQEVRPSGELDYSITAALDGEGEGNLTAQNCTLYYNWDVTSESAVIRYKVDVNTLGAAANSVIPQANATDLLRDYDVRYLAIDETPPFTGEEPFSAFKKGWFRSAPYFYPIYHDLGVTVYRVDESALNGPAQTNDSVLSADGPETPDAALLGWRQMNEARPGEMLTVALYWQGQQPIDDGYFVFVHLVKGPRMVALGDGLPSNGGSPTATWVPGQTVIDLHTMVLPADTAPGRYQLNVGLYATQGGERLPAYDGQGHRWYTDQVPLGTIEVLP